MIAAERGFLLLCSHLGNPERHPLTPARMKALSKLVQRCDRKESDRMLDCSDLAAMGCREEEARRICSLLEEEALLERYLQRAEKLSCHPLTRISDGYPEILRQKLGNNAPAVLWYRGNPELLKLEKISLVGSRRLYPENRDFARQVGREAVRQGFVLVSGNAIGSDQLGQQAALESGGRVISVLADELCVHQPPERTLFLCEDSFDLPFSSYRALSRNRIIHTLGNQTFVAQSSLQTGGSWDGSVKNLRSGWSPLFCFDDGRESTRLLEQLGANLIRTEQLQDFSHLRDAQMNLF